MNTKDKTMSIEEKAKEYTQQFRIKDAPVGSAIEMNKASTHFRAGYQAGSLEKQKEIIDKLKEIAEINLFLGIKEKLIEYIVELENLKE